MSRRGLYALFPDAREKSGLFVNYIEEHDKHMVLNRLLNNEQSLSIVSTLADLR